VPTSSASEGAPHTMEGATPADAAAAAAAAAAEDGPNPAAAAEVRSKITVLLAWLTLVHLSHLCH